MDKEMSNIAVSSTVNFPSRYLIVYHKEIKHNITWLFRNLWFVCFPNDNLTRMGLLIWNFLDFTEVNNLKTAYIIETLICWSETRRGMCDVLHW